MVFAEQLGILDPRMVWGWLQRGSGRAGLRQVRWWGGALQRWLGLI